MDPVVGSIIVAVILLAVIILIIHKLVSDKKKGKFSCCLLYTSDAADEL